MSVLAFTKGEFVFWVAVTVVSGLLLALLLAAINWLRKLIRERRSRPKAHPPEVDLNALSERARTHVQALLHEREGYVQRGLKDRVDQVDEQIVKTRDDWLKRANELRVALINIRSELESARRLLQETSERQSFWNPEQEELPGQRWEDYRETLAGEPEIEHTTAAIDTAYQDCNRLNQLVRERAEEGRREQEQRIRRPPGWTLSLDAMENDAEKVTAALADIDAATVAIAVSLEKL